MKGNSCQGFHLFEKMIYLPNYAELKKPGIKCQTLLINGNISTLQIKWTNIGNVTTDNHNQVVCTLGYLVKLEPAIAVGIG